MVGLIVTTHSEFAAGLKKSVEMITGTQDNFEAICFKNGESIEDLQDRIRSVAAEYKKNGLEVIYVADMLGASPFNASLAVATEYYGPVLCGACLPMMLELVLTRDSVTADELLNYSKNVIMNVKENLQVVDVAALME